uniref:Uncharacterized protein n=1 Tax=Kalanchoe fedtschenkoi TaxID=63787 RepID=A0A7N0ZV14_KALFE
MEDQYQSFKLRQKGCEALNLCILIAQQFDINISKIESDSSVLINFLKGDRNPSWSCIDISKQTGMRPGDILSQLIVKEGNMAAVSLVRADVNLYLNILSSELDYDDRTRKVIREDAMGLPRWTQR